MTSMEPHLQQRGVQLDMVMVEGVVSLTRWEEETRVLMDVEEC